MGDQRMQGEVFEAKPVKPEGENLTDRELLTMTLGYFREAEAMFPGLDKRRVAQACVAAAVCYMGEAGESCRGLVAKIEQLESQKIHLKVPERHRIHLPYGDFANQLKRNNAR